MHPLRRIIALGVKCVGLGVLAANVIAATPPALATDEGVVGLPPLMVEEKGIPLRWRYLELPGLEVLSVCDDHTSERFVRRQLRLEELLREILPEALRARMTVPDAYILFNEETGRARSREVIDAMVKKEGASVAPDGTVRLPLRLSGEGVLNRGGQRIRFLPNLRLTDIDAVRVFAIVRDTPDNPMEFTFARERIAFLLSRRTPALPDWFTEGMLAVYAQVRFDDREIEFGPAVWLSADESLALLREPHRPRALLPMAEFFEWRRALPGPASSEIEQLWRAQCALFVRWATAGKEGARREALWRFVDRLGREPPSEMLFSECFGLGYADARDRLSDYLPVAIGKPVMLHGPKPGPVPSIKFRAATDLEVARIRGDWERLQIRFVREHFPGLVDKYIEQARRTLRRVYDRGERDPQLLAVLGLTEADAGNPALAYGFLDVATRGGVVRPRVYLEHARALYRDMLAGDSEHRFTPEETQRVLAPLLRARLDDPPLVELYGLMASVWVKSETPPVAADLAVIDEGVRLFPGASALVMRAIHLHVSIGSIGPAAEFVEAGLRNTRDPAIRERFERVRAEMVRAK